MKIGTETTDNISSNPLATPRPLGRLRRPYGPVPQPPELLRPPCNQQQPTTLDGLKAAKTAGFLEILKITISIEKLKV